MKKSKNLNLESIIKINSEEELKKIYPNAKSVDRRSYKEYFEIIHGVFIRCDRFLKDGTPMRNLTDFNNDDIDFDKFEVTYIYKTKNKSKRTFTDLWKK